MLRVKPYLPAPTDDSAASQRAAALHALKQNLQLAIELEHATIPPYLYALYSIRDACNLEVAGLIRSVVLQEMLHMAIDCNVLNAIGGQPRLGATALIPSNTGPRPGGGEGHLRVGCVHGDRRAGRRRGW